MAGISWLSVGTFWLLTDNPVLLQVSHFFIIVGLFPIMPEEA